MKQKNCVYYVFISLMILWMICGCSGDHMRVFQKPNFPVINIKAKKIACVGDSITYGSTLSNRKVSAYPSRLKAMLTSDTICNFGVDGAAAQESTLLSYRDTQAFQDSLTYQPDVVFFMLGTNDSKEANWVSREHFKQEYKALLDEYRSLSHKPLIYLMVPSAAYSLQEDGALIHTFSQEHLTQIRESIREVAQEEDMKLIDIYEVTQEHPQDYLYDGIHPDENGALRIAETCASIYQQDQLKEWVITLGQWELSYFQDNVKQASTTMRNA